MSVNKQNQKCFITKESLEPNIYGLVEFNEIPLYWKWISELWKLNWGREWFFILNGIFVAEPNGAAVTYTEPRLECDMSHLIYDSFNYCSRLGPLLNNADCTWAMAISYRKPSFSHLKPAFLWFVGEWMVGPNVMVNPNSTTRTDAWRCSTT